MPSPNPLPPVIPELVQRFSDNLPSYRSGHYNETQLRREFLDPFFEALGWDVFNKSGYAEAYKDVVHEDAIRLAGAGRAPAAPDYAFRIGGMRKFFVEAKKPSVNIKEDISPAFQLRRYAWSSKLPLSILTDFEEFAVYDCRSRPDRSDKASTGRLLMLTFRDYVTRWDEIASIFGRQAVLKGSFDRYAEATSGKHGTAEVDDAFLAEIERWRDLLARNIALRNPQLSQRELNYAVQMTIDRIIFLRIAEDRGIEPYGALLGLVSAPEIYPRLGQLYYKADQRYNSGLFHFHAEKGQVDAPDALTFRLVIDDKPLKDILSNLYYPDSPYEFSVLPADILGQVYEQFLGKVIRLTAGHHAVVEDKPEVKKAGGVFYTPTYIVEYIVKNTLGALLEGKKAGEKGVGKGEPLRVVDPACGSGSFLLGAYQYLLDWYRDGYLAAGAEKWAQGSKPRLIQVAGGEYRLTTAERKRILLEHIFGVDIDPQAVEVTKLSLLLKVLESENEQTIGKQLTLLQERALPDLGRNIQCGNSLIGPDFYSGQQASFLDMEEQWRINAFDWQQAFPQVFREGGFDVVIGNPPYGATIDRELEKYLRSNYEASSKDLDTYPLFIEKAIKLCKVMGKVSMIVPTGWYNGVRYSILRKYFARITEPDIFINLPYDIFNAWVDTTIFVTTKRYESVKWPLEKSGITLIKTFPKKYKIRTEREFQQGYSKINFSDWFSNGRDEFLTYIDEKTISIFQKVEKNGLPLSEYADVQRGVTPFNLQESPIYPTSEHAFNGTVRRYVITHGAEAFIKYDESLAEFKPERFFKGPRILIRELISRQFRLQAVKVDEDFVTNKSMQSILGKSGSPNLNYLLGIINSRLISWFFLKKSNIAQRDDFPKIVLKETRSLPIYKIDFTDMMDVKRHGHIVNLVTRILALHQQLATANTPTEKTILQRQIDATDGEIDQLVYQLYALTPDEIALVEGD